MSRLWGIAAVQMAPVPFETEATVSKMEEVIAQTSRIFPWVQMFLFPELILDGLVHYTARGEKAPVKAQTIPGPLTEQLGALAAKYGKWLIPGSMSERDGDAVYNTAVVFSDKGDIAAKYRKMFPWRPLETCAAGSEFCVFDVPAVGRFGLCICYDMWFPEVARTLAWMGAEVILHPSLTATSDRGQEVVMSQANAIFNQCYFIDVNATGPFGGGRSLLVDPEGRVLQQADQHEAVMTEVLDLDKVTQTREFGTMGLSQPWKALRDLPVMFPPYSEGMTASKMVQGLGPMAYRGKLELPTASEEAVKPG